MGFLDSMEAFNKNFGGHPVYTGCSKKNQNVICFFIFNIMEAYKKVRFE